MKSSKLFFAVIVMLQIQSGLIAMDPNNKKRLEEFFGKGFIDSPLLLGKRKKKDALKDDTRREPGTKLACTELVPKGLMKPRALFFDAKDSRDKLADQSAVISDPAVPNSCDTGTR